jgi:ABC-2 type transport system ATP-binding protein
MTAAVVAEGLVKHYGPVKALDGLDLEVEEGTVLGLLGPNGAGKTTTVRILTTLLVPDAGRASVAGIDVLENPDELRGMIGLSGQYAAVDENLTGRENLDMFGRLYHMGAKAARARADELLQEFRLTDAAHRVVKTYSGGMRRRLDLAASLVAKPRILFLDEPTTGLDPRSRMGMWDVIADLVKGGATLLLTTQYLEEADQLADRIAVVDHGKVIAQGTADELKAQVGGEVVEIVIHDRDRLDDAAMALVSCCPAQPKVEQKAKRITVPAHGGSAVLVDAVRALDRMSIRIDDIALRRPTLDDVFMRLTGHATEDEDEELNEPVTAGRSA